LIIFHPNCALTPLPDIVINVVLADLEFLFEPNSHDISIVERIFWVVVGALDPKVDFLQAVIQRIKLYDIFP
jgi:hypothetical protein